MGLGKWGCERKGWTGERGQIEDVECLCDFLTLAESVSLTVRGEK